MTAHRLYAEGLGEPFRLDIGRFSIYHSFKTPTGGVWVQQDYSRIRP